MMEIILMTVLFIGGTDTANTGCIPVGEGGEICQPVDDQRFFCACQDRFVLTSADCECAPPETCSSCL